MKINATLEEVSLGADRVVIGVHDLGALRLPFERDAMSLLQAHPAYHRCANQDESADRRDASRGGIVLTRRAAPGLFALADEACRVLGVEDPLQIVQTATPIANASMLFTPGQPALMQLHGPLLSRLLPIEVLSVMGHELGHHLSYRALGFRRTLLSLVRDIYFHDEDGGELLEALYCLIQIGHELLADRYALLCAQDIDAELRVEMALTAGIPADEVGLSPAEYLDQCRAFVDDMIEREESQEPNTHPEHNIRVVAAWLFSESDLFKAFTGRGSGLFNMDEVNLGITSVIETEALAYEWSHNEQLPKKKGGGGVFAGLGSMFGFSEERDKEKK